MKQGFIKVATATPKVRVADPIFNVEQLISLTEEAAVKKVKVLVFPELSVTGYTCGDLFGSDTLLNAAKNALQTYLEATRSLDILSVVGVPFAVRDKLFNCGAVCKSGKLLGLVPKTNLPNYCEFYEVRNFTAYQPGATPGEIVFNGEKIPFGTDLLFACEEIPELRIALEICEDLWVPIPPSSFHACAGATVICNLSASNDTVGKNQYRRQLVQNQSARTVSAYLYSTCGEGESTTDLVFGGDSMICENGSVLAENPSFDFSEPLLITEIDVERLAHDRRRANTFPAFLAVNYREIGFHLTVEDTTLTRFVDPHPFIPSNQSERDNRCDLILKMQAQGLKQRIEKAYAKKIVIGISGGLDSTLALLVGVRALDELKRPRTDLIAVTMPCFGTTKRTKDNATVLCEELKVDFRCIPIGDAVNQHFADIGHDPAIRDVTYENCQARERTQVLMDVANDNGGMVIGTGDLSELALGWATYNGDHMSMYGVNGSVPKTLIRHIVGFYADRAEENGEKKLADALRDVLATPVSPELLPAEADGTIAQKTEDLVGPYELHDFYLYYFIRFGFEPEKLYRLAKYALGNVYSDETLKHWLETFLRRFFAQQFKRSCLPDGPKVGSISLSPRGDWRMPSDASSNAWKNKI